MQECFLFSEPQVSKLDTKNTGFADQMNMDSQPHEINTWWEDSTELNKD